MRNLLAIFLLSMLTLCTSAQSDKDIKLSAPNTERGLSIMKTLSVRHSVRECNGKRNSWHVQHRGERTGGDAGWSYRSSASPPVYSGGLRTFPRSHDQFSRSISLSGPSMDSCSSGDVRSEPEFHATKFRMSLLLGPWSTSGECSQEGMRR